MTLDEKDGPDRAGDGDVAVLDPIAELTEVRPLLDDLSGCTAEQRERLAPLIKTAEALEALTDWTRDQLLDNIGCGERDASKLAEDEAKIARCESFLGILLDAGSRVEGARICRAVVKRCARLSKASELDVGGLSEALHAGEVSALDYFELGEMASAERAARIAAGLEGPATAAGPSPYDEAPAVHISVPRVDLYVRKKREVLGGRAYDSIAMHVETCRGCESAVAERRSLLHLS